MLALRIALGVMELLELGQSVRLALPRLEVQLLLQKGLQVRRTGRHSRLLSSAGGPPWRSSAWALSKGGGAAGRPPFQGAGPALSLGSPCMEALPDTPAELADLPRAGPGSAEGCKS